MFTKTWLLGVHHNIAYDSKRRGEQKGGRRKKEEGREGGRKKGRKELKHLKGNNKCLTIGNLLYKLCFIPKQLNNMGKKNNY